MIQPHTKRRTKTMNCAKDDFITKCMELLIIDFGASYHLERCNVPTMRGELSECISINKKNSRTTIFINMDFYFSRYMRGFPLSILLEDMENEYRDNIIEVSTLFDINELASIIDNALLLC